MIQIGTLVKNYRSMGIVVDHWIDDKSGEYHVVIKWLNGRHVGASYKLYNDSVEIIA